MYKDVFGVFSRTIRIVVVNRCSKPPATRQSRRLPIQRTRLHSPGSRCYLNTYAPLVATAAGRAAAEKFDILPFVDGSIRREPDLEHRFPSISCLCRADKFAPRLQIDDVVAYMTKKNRFGTGVRHYRLTAVLKVKAIFENHLSAAEWYISQGQQLPNNCMVPDNGAKPLDESHRFDGFQDNVSDALRHRRWDNAYKWRANQFGTFVACHALFSDLTWNARVIEDDAFTNAFGRMPGTRNPGALPADEFWAFLESLEIRVRPSCR